MQTIERTIEVTKQNRTNNIYICYIELDRFGVSLAKRVLFSSCADYELDSNLKQAENLKHIY
jgi:hypothetical protein